MAELKRHAAGVREPMERLIADGVELALSRQGKGLPLICLHATGHGGGDFSALADRLVHLPIEIITLDWPGQGRSASDRTGQSASASRYATLLEEIVARVAVDRTPVLLGNSIGGAAAIRYAAKNPHRVAALVICDAGGLAPIDRPSKMFINAMDLFIGAGAQGAWWFQPAFAMYYRTILPAKPARLQRSRIIAAISETAPVVQQAWRSFADPRENLIETVSALKVPVLFAWSRNDRVVSYARSRRAIASTPNATVRIFAGGHSAFLEDPDLFADELVKFLTKEGVLQ